MKKYISILFILLAVTNSKAQDALTTLTDKKVQAIFNGAIAYAKEHQLKIAVAVYDAHAQLIGFIRMDSTTVGTSKVALWKGLSAAIYHYSTEETAQWNVPNAPDIATVPGGVVIKSKSGKVLGAVGVSGAIATDDVKCANAGILAANLEY
jgi:glc operon protein GlcG